MKLTISLLAAIVLITFIGSCDLLNKDDDTIGDEQSPMGVVGTTVSSSSMEIAGVKMFQGTVQSVDNGVSTYKGSAVVTNTFLKNLMSNFPEIIVKGDTLSTESIKFKLTKEGVELKSGPTSGIWVKYSSEVGDKYPIGSTGNYRTVVSKSSTDDYYYGFLLIKVLQVEENPGLLKSSGVNKITYIANHRFGLVGVNFNFDDGTSAQFPIYCSAEN